MANIVSPITFIDKLVKKNELGQPFRLMDHQREILRLAFAFDERGRLPWDTIIYSTVKKSGKTTINGALTLWWAFTQEAPNEILVLANDLEQSLARVFSTMEGIIEHNPELKQECEVQSKNIYLNNGTTISAISGDYAGAAGSNHGFISYDELWAYVSESSTRLWEELTPVPTRKNSVRFISTYAGFEGESELLMNFYKQVIGKDEHPEGQGERLHPEVPVYANREARIFAYWDHEPRMPWQTAEYYESQKRTLRAGTYLRLHENRWTTSETTFITPELWDGCITQTNQPGFQTNRITEIVVDPWQAHRSIATLQAAGLPIREFPQTVSNTTRMGQVLFDLLNGRKLRLYPAADLRQQALSTVGIETARGTRISKDKQSKKIDAIVALAMACVAAVDHGQTGDGSLFVGVDLATKHDSAAVVSVAWTSEGALRLVTHRIWQPSPEHPLDLENTVEWHLRELHSQGMWANGQRKKTVVQLTNPNRRSIFDYPGRR